MRLWLPALAVAMVVPLACYPSSRSQRDRGAKVFDENGCTHCHKMHNSGGTTGPDLSGVGRRLTEAQMRKQIVEGSKVMPAFGEVLDGTEIEDLLAYLHSCRDTGRK